VEAILDSRNGLDANAKDSNFGVSHQSAGHTRVDFQKQLRGNRLKMVFCSVGCPDCSLL